MVSAAVAATMIVAAATVVAATMDAVANKLSSLVS